MFASIAPRYDRANRILSLRQDLAWRRRSARELLSSPGLVLDLASGTAELTTALRRRHHRVVSADFTFEMLLGARHKLHHTFRQIAADAGRLPFRENSFDGVTVGFGVRNFADLGGCLKEILRVTRRHGAVLVLEFSRPPAGIDFFFQWYSSRVLPWLGGMLTGSRPAYEYLNQSSREFPAGQRFLDILREAGLSELTMHRLTLGIATIYRGVKP